MPRVSPTCLLLCVLCYFLVVPAEGQPQPRNAANVNQLPQKGGMMFPAGGEVKALVVFVQFAGDTLERDNPLWPPSRGPAYMHRYLDSTVAPPVPDGSLSHFLRAMSFGRLRISGDAVHVTTAHPRQWYVENGRTFSDINREVLAALDAPIDFSQYDRWTFGHNYDHRHRPDGVVDLLILIHRERYRGQFGLYNGVSVVFYGPADLYVDEGKTIIRRGFPGSGFTLDSGMYDPHIARAAHEIAHKWFGAGHPRYHNDPPGVSNYAFWGIMIGHGGFFNAYERAWLGWSDLTTLTADSLVVTVSDFITTGDAYRIPLPGTPDEAFIIENHQEISPFDRPNKYGRGKGLYIYHVKGSGPMPVYDLEVAEGKFDWVNTRWVKHPWGSRPTDSLAAFAKGPPNRRGFDALDALPTTRHKPGSRVIYQKHYVEDLGDSILNNRRTYGSEWDAFDIGYNQVFSPWSNPNSHRWDEKTPSGITIELLDKTEENGAAVYTVKIYRKNGENAAPANPQLLGAETVRPGKGSGVRLIWLRNLEPDIAGYVVYRQTGEHPPVNLSGKAPLRDTTFVDPAPPPEPSRYAVIALDRQGKRSNFSRLVIPANRAGKIPRR